jgi:NADH-quinone oxidoreductase subunit N
MTESFNWAMIYPEILLLLMACVISLADLSVDHLKSPGRTLTYLLSVSTLAVVAVIAAVNAASGEVGFAFNNMVVYDPLGNWLKSFASIAMIVTFVYGRPYSMDRGMLKGGEYFILSLFAMLGIFVMISSNNFLLVYLGLELTTLSSYALVALRRDNGLATEAAIKYFVLGAMASGFLLYGMSMLYGATGSLDITNVFKATMTGQIKHQVLVLGVVFIVCGLAFKFGAVPFHMWVPDVYQGAPTSVTLLIAGAPKLAAFAIAIRLLVDGLMPLALEWQQMLMVLSICSLLIGNFAAIMQTNLKRMLAYSTISHMGFMMIGLFSGVVDNNTQGAANAYSAAMFYIVTYVLTTLATFGVIMLLSREGFESEEISDFSGLNQRSPLYAGVMTVCLFSLAGVPPLVGFYAKLAVLQSLVSSGLPGGVGIAIFAVAMSLVGAFYYLRVIKVMYFDAPLTATTVSATQDVRIVLSLNGALVVLLGLLPGGLMTICSDSIVRSLGN